MKAAGRLWRKPSPPVAELPPGEAPPLPNMLGLVRRLLAQVVREHGRRFMLAGASMAVVAAMTTAMAWIMRDVVNQIFVSGNREVLALISVAILLIAIVKGVATYVSSVTMARIGNAIVVESRRRMFDKTLAMSLDFHLRSGSARMVTNMIAVANAAKSVIEMVVSTLVRDLLTLVGLCAVMLYQKPVLALIAFLTAPIAVLQTTRMAANVRASARDELQAEAGVVQAVQETVRGIGDVKSFRFEGRMRRRAHEAAEGARRRADHIARVVASTAPLMETLGGVAVAAVIFYGGWRAIEAREPPGALMAFITALLLAYEPAKRLARLRVALTAPLIAIQRMFDLLDLEPTVQERAGARDLKVGAGEIRFEGVTFAYPGAGRPLFEGFDLLIPGRGMTALIGPSGGGKSSVVRLLLRFYDVGKGRVLVDGQDISRCTLASLQGAISYVGQDAFLFEDTVAENIRVGAPDAGREAVELAARQAGAHDFISGLPQGYETLIGENGVKLSGGQRQRLAIARAFLKSAPILVLDEATSALDAGSERTILGSLTERRRDTTILVITHRLGIVRQADRICVLDEGRLLEAGSHDELTRSRGLYARLLALHDLGVDAVLEHAPDLERGSGGPA